MDKINFLSADYWAVKLLLQATINVSYNFNSHIWKIFTDILIKLDVWCDLQYIINIKYLLT